VAGAAVGAGRPIGVALSVILDRHHAKYLEEHLRRGGILL
jgi:hypothetical protein